VVEIPVILVGKSFWNEMVNFQGMVKLGVIDDNDMKAIHFVETAQEAWHIIQDWYQLA
jgi:predicted Rossmann-fold nucleotide-binding protein